MDALLKCDKVQTQLTNYACSLDYDMLPSDVIQAAKARIVDTLGVLVSGFDGEPCKVIRNLAKELNYPGRSTILGTNWKNFRRNGGTGERHYGSLCRTDRHLPLARAACTGTRSDTVAPIFSVAEHAARQAARNLSPPWVLSYEVFCRISDAFHNKGFDAVNFGCIATALASAKLLKLTPEQTAQALSLAAAPNVILKQVRVDNLTMFKVAAAGHAARAGVFAALMARAGMAGLRTSRSKAGTAGAIMSRSGRSRSTLWGGKALTSSCRRPASSIVPVQEIRFRRRWQRRKSRLCRIRTR